MSKIYITGSGGFIGSHLLKRLPKRNVTCLPHTYCNSVDPLEMLFEQNPPDYIFHLSSYGNMASQQDEAEMIRANNMALMNLMLASRRYDYKSFINFSSSSVYGNKKHPMHETNSLESKTFYGVTKISGELLVRAFVEKYDKPIVNVRPFSIYGPGEASFRFIPTVIRCLKKKEPMKLAPGMHDWVFCEDFIDALMLVQENVNELKGKAVNIGTGVEYDNYDVFKKLCLIAGILNPNKLPIEHISSLRSQDSWVADNSLIKSLGWLPAHSLQEGLEKVWNS